MIGMRHCDSPSMNSDTRLTTTTRDTKLSTGTCHTRQVLLGAQPCFLYSRGSVGNTTMFIGSCPDAYISHMASSDRSKSRTHLRVSNKGIVSRFRSSLARSCLSLSLIHISEPTRPY
eukprot:TRINITY_DN40278_c0_g1_i1.p1 TRINITY_DN40278_c0_g1~~TRINITY_DN40278_c0_g1_i1.p1  ORF type:complete len:117 (-),score=3.33 TRINITY_DN40278_c0_g1_i1:38-388(-)